MPRLASKGTIQVGITPSQSVESRLDSGLAYAPEAALLDEFWLACDAASYGVTRVGFNEILLRAAAAQNFGQPAETILSTPQKAAYLRAVKINDLVLAQSCAAGNERAWQHFVALYHEPLTRAAIAITGSETLGRDLAGSLYGELYGVSERDGQRRCPLEGYRGRGSLIGWLRTTLAQRHVDHFRRTHREQPLDDASLALDSAVPAPAAPPQNLSQLAQAIEQSLSRLANQDRFLLASYYLDERTLLQIAQLLDVHEATVSRRLHRTTGELRKQILRNLERAGMSRRAAEEAMGADPRDVLLDVKKLLQISAAEPFQEKTAR
jgi:RNA polymerase sigma-70 factor, ECF subfamily